VSGAVDPAFVRQIWEAVAEDVAPFEVNVTTDPDSPRASGRGLRVAIGPVHIESANPRKESTNPPKALGYSPAICESDSLQHPVYLKPRIPNVAVVDYQTTSSVSAREMAKRISHEAFSPAPGARDG